MVAIWLPIVGMLLVSIQVKRCFKRVSTPLLSLPLGQVALKNTQQKLNFSTMTYPASACGGNFKVLDEKSLIGVVGKREQLKVQSVDAFGNNRRFGGDRIYATLSKLSSSAQTSKLTMDAEDYLDGKYTLSYYVTTSGSYIMRCFWEPRRENESRKEPVCFFAGRLTIQPGPVSPQASIVDSSGLAHCRATCVSTISIRFRDQFGNPRDLKAFPYEKDNLSQTSSNGT